MKKVTTIILTFILAFTSCKGEYNNLDEIANSQSNDLPTLNIKGKTGIITNKYFPVLDNKQKVVGAYPFPSDCYLGDYDDFSVFIQHPSGAKVFKSQSYYYTDYRSSKLNEMHKTLGNAAAFKSVESIIKESFLPVADSLNMKLTNKFETPEVAEIYKKKSFLYFSLSKPKEETFKAIATEWLNDKGIKSIAVIVHHTQILENKTIWGFTLHEMEVAEANFETAKEIFLFSLKNYKTCYQYIYDENKIAIASVSNDYTSRYFTLKEKQEKRDFISVEKQRTGMNSTFTFDDYLKHLKSNGTIINDDAMHICNLTAKYKKDEITTQYLDSLYTLDIHYDHYITERDSSYYVDSWDRNPVERDDLPESAYDMSEVFKNTTDSSSVSSSNYLSSEYNYEDY